MSADPSSLPPVPDEPGVFPRNDDSKTLEFLNRLAAALLGQSDPEAIIATVERMLGGHLQASRVLVAEASDDGETVEVRRTWSRPGLPCVDGIHRLADYGERLLADYRSGRTHIRRDAALENPPGPALDAFRAIGAMAAIDVPVLIDGQFRMLLVVHQTTPRDWTDGEVALVRQIADRTASEVQRARALRTAQESESHFRQMADAMPQIVWGAGPDGVPDWFNRRWYDYTGFAPGNGNGLQEMWQAAFVAEDFQAMAGAWEHAVRTGTPHSVEARLPRSSDGMPRWHLVRANPVVEADGTVTCWYGTLTDIHDPKLNAEAAIRGEFRLASALQVVDMGIVDWNLRTGTVTMDARAREFYGFAPDFAISVEEIHNRIDPADTERVAAAAYESAKAGTRLEIEYTVRVPGQEPRRIFSVSQVSTGSDGTLESLYGVLMDVTSRHRAAEEREQLIRTIEAERANLAAVVESAPAFICVLRGPDHVLELANESYHQIVGRRMETGKRIRELLPELEGQGFFELLDQVYASGEPVTGTEVPVTLMPAGAPDRQLYVNFVYQALSGPDKKPNGVFVHGVDVTESVRSREVIADSERRRRLALDAAKVGAFNLDPTAGVLTTDERFRAIFGIQGDHATYEEALAAIHPDDLPRVREAVAAATTPLDPMPYAVDHRVVHPDGSVHWVAVRGGTSIEDTPAGPRLKSLDGTVADISDRRAAEDALAFQRHQLELIFRESPAAMALWRGENLIFERVNPHYQAMFGDRPLEGLPLLEAVPELAGQGFDDVLREVLHTGVPFVGREVLARFASSPGSPPIDRYFDFTYLQVQDPDGRPYGVYDHAVDVTERVLARQDLEKSQLKLREALSERQSLLDAERAARGEAEMAGRMKDEFLATLSHELRTPLTAIVGWTQILQMMPDQPQRITDGLAVISRNAKAQTQIIEDILDMSRIISGKLRLDVQKVDLAGLIKAGEETVQPAADAKGVALHVMAEPAVGMISGDAHRLHQVFWNLISNAVKFTPKGGRVLVTLKHGDGHVEASVEDTGEGIAPEFLPHMFDRFRQADSSTTRHHGGLGLGLAIVKQIVELHGGTVRASSPGKGLGATFTVTLPLSMAPSVPSGEAPAGSEPSSDSLRSVLVPVNYAQLAGVTVVAVDDERDVVDFIERLLTGCGAIVRKAMSAAEALTLVQADPPTLIVSDIGMPGEDGYAFIRNVRALPADRGGRVPALAVTAYARTVDRVRALEAGFQMHVAKPVDPSELIASVAALAKAVAGK
jgi:PAS domain S-box-containing protein